MHAFHMHEMKLRKTLPPEKIDEKIIERFYANDKMYMSNHVSQLDKL